MNECQYLRDSRSSRSDSDGAITFQLERRRTIITTLTGTAILYTSEHPYSVDERSRSIPHSFGHFPSLLSLDRRRMLLAAMVLVTRP